VRLLGTLTLHVSLTDDGHTVVHHDTALATALDEMQWAMSDAEKAAALQMRAQACAWGAKFFECVENPDKLGVKVKPAEAPRG
jgi:hypothetical protein